MSDSVAAAPSAALLRACRAMLRHADHPAYLRGNAVVERIAAVASVRTDPCTDDALRTLVRTAIEHALATLPPRQQTIVRRCDLGGERFADVARALAISERHAFRERDAAVTALLDRLTVAPALAERANPRGDVVASQLVQARVLEHNGHGAAAAALLNELLAAASEPGLRCTIETYLIRLHADAERFDEAQRHLDAARECAAGLPGSARWHAAEIDVAAARLAEARGDVAAADALARGACAALRSEIDRRGDSHLRNALVDALVLRATLAVGHGAMAAAAEYAAAAHAAADTATDAQTAIAARSIATMTQLFGTGDAAHVEAELFGCYRAATGAGLTREALVVATHLAGLYRLTKRPQCAVAMLTPLVATARLVAMRECAAGVFNELAAAHLDAGDTAAAATYLVDLHAYSHGHTLMEPTSKLLMARIHSANGDHAAALGAALDAEAGFARIGKERLEGTALRLQAAALAGLGDKRRAIETVKHAIAVLSGRSHPEPLAAAYRLLGTLSGDFTYESAARKLARFR